MSKRRRRAAARRRQSAVKVAPVKAIETSQATSANAERDVRQERWSALIFLALIALLVAGSVAYASLTDNDPTSTGNGGAGEMPGVMAFGYRGGDHTDDEVIYQEAPPVGGPHADVWQNCAFYSAPIIEEQAVHSLEHGAVWITYRPDLDPEQIAAMQTLADTQDFVLISPVPGLGAPLVVSAWNHQLPLDSATDPRLTDFIRAFRQSSTAPERGAPCSGGSSETAGG